jgi:hypothetical protein
MCEDSYNGGAKRRLAGSEWRSVLISALGKSDEKGSFGRCLPFYRQSERGVKLVPHVGIGRPTARRSGRDVAHIGFPCPRYLTGGHQWHFEGWRVCTRAALFIAQPVKN